MLFTFNPLTLAATAAALGFAIGFVARKIISSRRIAQAEARAQTVLNESKSKSQDILLEAKNKAIKLLEDAKSDEQERRVQLGKIENLLTKKEVELESKEKDLLQEKNTLKAKGEELVVLKADLEQGRQRQLKELERVTGLRREEAREELLKKVEEEYRDDLYQRLRKLDTEGHEEIDRTARELLTMSIQRYAGSHIADVPSTIVTLPSDDAKGQSIGKER